MTEYAYYDTEAEAKSGANGSNDVQSHVSANRRGDTPQIVRVAREDQIATCERRHHNNGVDDILVVARCRCRSGGSGLGLAQRLDATSPQEARELRLGASTPHLPEHGRRDGGTNAALE
ncbi:MAG TPA: hypothetical protein VK730_02205 [Solirubrobacteraceae bacterium]|jgi:hypothetical protein|nr:hypothetical protein [Solirubrobacteraceae bacterium]